MGKPKHEVIGMKILYWHTEDAYERYKDARLQVEALKPLGYDIDIRLTEMYDEYSCWKVLNDYWGKEDLFIIDQDIMFTREQLDSIITCKEPLCACYYGGPLFNGPTARYCAGSFWHEAGWDEHVCLFRDNANRTNELDIADIRKGLITHVDWMSNGFCKISKAIQTKPMDKFDVNSPKGIGKGIDLAISENLRRAVPGIKFHVHGEVKHLHNHAYSFYKRDVPKGTPIIM